MPSKNTEDRSDVLYQLETLKPQLQALYKDIENAKVEFEKYQVDEKDKEKLQKKIADLKEEKDTAEFGLKALEKELDKIQNDITAQRSQKQEEYSKMQGQIEEAQATLEVIKKDVDTNSKVLTETDTKCKLKSDWLAVLEKQRLDLETALEKLKTQTNQQNSMLEEINKGLTSAKSELTKLNNEKKDSENQIQTNLSVIQKHKQDIAELEGKKGKILADYEERQNTIDVDLVERDKALDKREAEIAEREAKMSVKEAWVKDTVDKVNKWKASLEKKTGELTAPLNL